ncbi:hypothetical protein Ae201684P_010312 [Aphanomyces euteiches]|nr:hypothetical protein Ae201684P_010312 [Aphanomyces euteiches]
MDSPLSFRTPWDIDMPWRQLIQQLLGSIQRQIMNAGACEILVFASERSSMDELFDYRRKNTIQDFLILVSKFDVRDDVAKWQIRVAVADIHKSYEITQRLHFVQNCTLVVVEPVATTNTPRASMGVATLHFALQTSPMTHTTVSRMGHFHTSVHLANRFDVARAVSTAQALTSHIGIASVVETLGFPAMLDASIARVGLVFTGWGGAFRAVFMDVALGIICSGILTSLEHAKWSGLHGYKILFLDFES